MTWNGSSIGFSTEACQQTGFSQNLTLIKAPCVCLLETETISHFFYKCQVTNTFLQQTQIFMETLNLGFRISEKIILFGNNSQDQNSFSNLMILYMKKHIWLSKQRSTHPNIMHLNHLLKCALQIWIMCINLCTMRMSSISNMVYCMNILFRNMEEQPSNDEPTGPFVYGPDPFPVSRPLYNYGSPYKFAPCTVCKIRFNQSVKHRHHSSMYFQENNMRLYGPTVNCPTCKVQHNWEVGSRTTVLFTTSTLHNVFLDPGVQVAIPYRHRVNLWRQDVWTLPSLEGRIH